MILHVDLNSFYASCAVVESGGRYTFDTPLMVCGDPKHRHGIVLAATYVVKKKGVHAGMPLFEAKARCPEAVIAEPDYRLYMDYSDKFMRIIKNYSPLIMRYGIDEAYLDYAGCEHIFGPPVQAAYTIKERVKRELGLTVSVGVGENPIMAKMGSDYKKPDAVTVLDRESWKKLIWPLPVGDLMYVGSATKKRLNTLGIYTIGALANTGLTGLKGYFGKCGLDMWMHANGMDDTRIVSEPEPQKCVSNSVTLREDITTYEQALTALLGQTEKVAYKLREMGVRAGVAGVHFRYNDFSGASRRTTLTKPTDITEELFAAIKALALTLPLNLPVRQLGVHFDKLTRECEQLSILDGERRERMHSLDAATDSMRKKYGADIINRCSMMKWDKDEYGEFTPFTRH